MNHQFQSDRPGVLAQEQGWKEIFTMTLFLEYHTETREI